MNIEISRPFAFYALLILVPSSIYTIFRYVKLLKSLKNNFGDAQKEEMKISDIQTRSFRRLRRTLLLREAFRAFSWICLSLAFAGISWGSQAVPVPKTGEAVSLVFDISYSMLAKDAPGGTTRICAATAYANELLERMEGTSVSVVLAKGDGILAVPLTEDSASIKPLLNTLSPKLMSAVGTSIGKGIEEAIRSFPSQSSREASIWVFTDGEETDSRLSASLAEALKYGISVIIIGFGSERESEVYAGDETTIIKTALRAAKIRDTIKTVQAKKGGIKRAKGVKTASLDFVDASELGSALKILSSISALSQKNDRQHVSYEVQPIQREGLFTALAIMFFLLSFIIGEADFSMFRKKRALKASAAVLLCVSLSSCSAAFEESKSILEGTWNYHQKKYRQATADFLRAAESAEASQNDFLREYALYNLASTYLIQNEAEAASSKFVLVAPDASPSVRFSALYNLGIISHRKGDYTAAADYFKQSLLIDSTNINAKINLELSLQQREESQARNGEQQLLPVAQNESASTVEDAVFSVIQENDKKQWKNQENQSSSNSENDY